MFTIQEPKYEYGYEHRQRITESMKKLATLFNSASNLKFRFSENKSINWNGRSRNAFGKSRLGGRGTVIYGTKGSVFVNRKEYTVYDLKGNIVSSSNSTKLHITDRKAGLYFIRLFDNNGNSNIQKLIINK